MFIPKCLSAKVSVTLESVWCTKIPDLPEQLLTMIRNSRLPYLEVPETEKREYNRTQNQAFPENFLGDNRRNFEGCNFLLNLFVQGTSWSLWSSWGQLERSDLDQNLWILTGLECKPQLRFLTPVCPALLSLYHLRLTSGFVRAEGLVSQGYCQVQKVRQTVPHFWFCGRLELWCGIRYPQQLSEKT